MLLHPFSQGAGCSVYHLACEIIRNIVKCKNYFLICKKNDLFLDLQSIRYRKR